MIKCKFKIVSKTKREGYDQVNKCSAPSYSIEAQVVYTGSPENEQYFLATPGGKLDLMVMNKRAADQIEPGDEVYITIEKANKD